MKKSKYMSHDLSLIFSILAITLLIAAALLYQHQTNAITVRSTQNQTNGNSQYSICINGDCTNGKCISNSCQTSIKCINDECQKSITNKLP